MKKTNHDKNIWCTLQIFRKIHTPCLSEQVWTKSCLQTGGQRDGHAGSNITPLNFVLGGIKKNQRIQNSKKLLHCLQANLEVISKWPISQHFKERVMVDILPHVVQIVVFSSCSDTFLGISSSHILCHVTIGINYLQKYGLELIKNKREIQTQDTLGYLNMLNILFIFESWYLQLSFKGKKSKILRM